MALDKQESTTPDGAPTGVPTGAPTGNERIAAAVTRLESAVERRRGFGRTTNATSTSLGDGLRCRSQEGAWSLETDLAVGLGGSASAPPPGVLMRAALGSCVAMGYRLRAARRGIPVGSIRVTVESDSEIDGMLRVASTAPPGFTAIRYYVELDTTAPDGAVAAMVDEADRLSPMLDAIGRANRIHRSLSVNGGVR